ncbi:MAG: hypothetical protein F6K09_10550, partial [Merismopedia sp. SIO2A8]|nr:hypothetical protein [Merismopedia sp. SIO2A8]
PQYLTPGDIPACDLGNPMMDHLAPTHALSYPTLSHASTPPLPHSSTPAPLTIVLLPGSRAPEAHRNWHLILQSIPSIQAAIPHRPLVLLAAIAPSLDLSPFLALLSSSQWQSIETSGSTLGFVLQQSEERVDWVDDRKPNSLANSLTTAGATETGETGEAIQNPKSKIQNPLLLLTQNAFNDCIHQADIAIALAGTATEQCVGLGKPAITIPGAGPQFTPAFAEAQTRLLGPSVIPVSSPDGVGDAIASLLAHPVQQAHIRENGRSRMGTPGAAERIAQCLMTVLPY